MTRAVTSPHRGLAALRERGVLGELLFLYECLTQSPTALQPVAARLGLTVQAVSHQYRRLRRRGLVALRAGRYVPTVEGVAWLHANLRGLGDDVFDRIGRLRVIRSCRAIAVAPLRAGEAVSLELRDGLLSARPGGTGSSRGRVAHGGPAGALVEVVDLEGIVTLRPAPVQVRTLTEADLEDPALRVRLRTELERLPGLLAADGLEAFHSLRSAVDRPVLRLAVAEQVAEASHLGVPSAVLVLDRDLGRLLARIAERAAPPLDIRPLGGRRAAGPPQGRPARPRR